MPQVLATRKLRTSKKNLSYLHTTNMENRHGKSIDIFLAVTEDDTTDAECCIPTCRVALELYI